MLTIHSVRARLKTFLWLLAAIVVASGCGSSKKPSTASNGPSGPAGAGAPQQGATSTTAPSIWQVALDPAEPPFEYNESFALPMSTPALVLHPLARSPAVLIRELGAWDNGGTIYDLRTGESTGEWKPRQKVSQPVQLSPDGRYVVSMGGEATAVRFVIHDTHSGEQREEALADGQLLFASQITPDGNVLALSRALRGARLEGAVIPLDPAGKRQTFSIPMSTMRPYVHGSLAVSGGGRFAALISGDDLILVDVRQNKEVGRRPLPENTKKRLSTSDGLRFSDDGKQLAALLRVDNNSELIVWDLRDGSVAFQESLGSPLSIRNKTRRGFGTATPNLDWLASGPDWVLYGALMRSASGEAQLYPPGANNQDGTVLGTNSVAQLRQLEDGWSLRVVSVDRSASTDQLAGGPTAPEPAKPEPTKPSKAKPKPNDPPPEPVEPPKPTAVAWSVEPDPQTVPWEPQGSFRFTNAAFRKAWHPSHSPFVAVDGAQQQAVYDLRSGRQVLIPGESFNPPREMLVDRQGGWLVRNVRSQESEVQVWSLATARQTLRYSIPRDAQVLRIAEGPDQTVVLGISALDRNSRQRKFVLQTVKLSDGSEGARLLAPPGTGRYMFGMATSPGGRYAAVAHVGRLVVHDLREKKLAGQLEIPAGPDRKLLDRCWGWEWSPDGQHLAALLSNVEENSPLQLITWDMQSGKLTEQAALADPKSLLQTDKGVTNDETGLQWLADASGWLLFGQLVVDRKGEVIERLDATPDQHTWPLAGGWLLTRRVQGGLTAALVARGSELAAALPNPTSSDPNPINPAVPRLPKVWQVAVDPVWQNVDLYTRKKFSFEVPARGSLLFPETASNFAVVIDRTKGPLLIDLHAEKIAGQLGKLNLHDPLAVSPDGKYFAGELSGKGIHVWSFATGKSVPIPVSYVAKLELLRFSLPHHLVAVNKATRRGIEVTVWDVRTGKQLAAFNENPNYRGTLFYEDHAGTVSPGGRYLATVVADRLLVWDIQTQQLAGRQTLPIYRPNNDGGVLYAADLRFSHDGSQLACLYVKGQSQHLFCWDVPTGNLRLHRVYQTPLSSRLIGASQYDGPPLEWSPDRGHWLVYGRIAVDQQTGAAVAVLPELDNQEPVRLLGPGRLLASKQESDTLMLGTLELPSVSKALAAARAAKSENAPPLQAAKTDATRIVSAAETVGWSAQPWQPPASVAGGVEPIRYGAQTMASPAVRFAAPDQTRVCVQLTANAPAFQAGDGPLPPEQRNHLEVYDLLSAKQLHRFEITARYELADFSPDGSLVLTGNPTEPLGSTYDRLDVWFPQTGKHLVGWSPLTTESSNADRIVDFAVFINKQTVLTRSHRNLTLWKLPECEAVYRIPSFGNVVGLSPDRRYVVEHHRSLKKTRVWETASGALAGILETPELTGAISHVSFEPHGNRVLGLSPGFRFTRVLQWNWSDGTLESEFGTQTISTVARSDFNWLDARYLLVDGKHLVDLENRALVHHYDHPRGRPVPSRADHRHWYLGKGIREAPFPHVLTSATLPDQNVRNQTQNIRMENQAILYPGGAVAVRLDTNLDQQPLEAWLKPKLEANQFHRDPSSSIQIVVTARQSDTGKTVQGDAGKVYRAQQIRLAVQIQAGGGEAWKVERVAPMSPGLFERVRNDAGYEALLQGMRKLYETQLANILLPQYIFPENPRTPLATSKLPSDF